MGFTDLLLRTLGNQLETTKLEYLNNIKSNAQTIEKIIHNLQILCRIKQANIHGFKPINLSNIVREILQEITNLNPDIKTQLTIQPEIIVEGEQDLLKIALDNIIKNAWKYSSKNPEIILEFGLTSLQKMRENKLNIPQNILIKLAKEQPIYFLKDNGIGFPQKKSKEIFETFIRLHSAADFEGTGIGLAIVKSIIEYHQGNIWANSEVNQGTTIYFTLPHK